MIVQRFEETFYSPKKEDTEGSGFSIGVGVGSFDEAFGKARDGGAVENIGKRVIET